MVWFLCVRLKYGYEIFFFFFFQAEDGIRYLTVTGVQTCALPISDGSCAPTSRSVTRAVTAGSRSPRPRSEERRVGKSVDLGGRRIIKKKKLEDTHVIAVDRAKREIHEAKSKGVR